MYQIMVSLDILSIYTHKGRRHFPGAIADAGPGLGPNRTRSCSFKLKVLLEP